MRVRDRDDRDGPAAKKAPPHRAPGSAALAAVYSHAIYTLEPTWPMVDAIIGHRVQHRVPRRVTPGKGRGRCSLRRHALYPSAPVAVALETKMELENASLETASEAALVGILPLAVDDFERDVLVRRTSFETEQASVLSRRMREGWRR